MFQTNNHFYVFSLSEGTTRKHPQNPHWNNSIWSIRYVSDLNGMILARGYGLLDIEQV